MKKPSRPSEESVGEIREFFDQWSIYRKIIADDYMAHQGIHAALRAFLREFGSANLTLLDLGCGDASLIAPTLRGTHVGRYVGVDLSATALAQAAETLAETDLKVSLIEHNLADYLAAQSADEVDVVLAGFSLHHFSQARKQTFFEDCRRVLKAEGVLLLYDVVLAEHESRDSWVERYCRHCQSEWTALNPAERDAVCAHLTAADFPESFATLQTLAQRAGFPAIAAKSLYLDPAGLHQLCCFPLRAGD